MVVGARAEWFSVFEIWFAARFRAEFPDADWTFLVNDPAARISAMPRGQDEAKVTVPLPPEFLTLDPYVAAATLAAQVRMNAEAAGLVERRRGRASKRDSERSLSS